MTQAFVYKWTQLSTGKWYVGSRSAKGCHINDGYLCSSKIVKPMILENKSDWNRNILVIGNPQYIKNIEACYLKNVDAKNDPMSFNEHNGDGLFNSTGHNKGRKTVHKNGIYKRVIPEVLNEFLSSGWALGTPANVREKLSSSTVGKTKPGHSNGGPKKGSIPWNKGRKETRPEVLEKQSFSHIGKTYAKDKQSINKGEI